MKEYASPQNIEDNKREDICSVARGEINMIYESYATNRERVNILKEAVMKVSQSIENLDETLANIEMCVEIDDKKKFVDAIFQATQPLINLKVNSPEPLMTAGEDSKEIIRINNLLLYEIKGDYLELHIGPNQSVKNVLSELTKGFYELAELVSKNKEINKIVGESWIVARHPRLMKKLGFSISGENYNSKTGGLTNRVNMTREEFLSKYLKE